MAEVVSRPEKDLAAQRSGLLLWGLPLAVAAVVLVGAPLLIWGPELVWGKYAEPTAASV
jgi:hypothetical protein